MSLISLSPRRLSNVQCPFQSQSSSLVDITPLSISVKYKSLEKTILGQVYGKVLSFFITPSLCLLLWWWWQKSAFCPVVRSLPSTPCFHFNTPRLTYPGTRKNFFKREALLPFSTLQNSTFSSYYALLDCWLGGGRLEQIAASHFSIQSIDFLLVLPLSPSPFSSQANSI